MFELEGKRTIRGYILGWRNQPLFADNPLDAWQGLLDARGLHETDAFFSPALSNLPDPFLMQDMDKAATRLAEAIVAGEKVHVFGDFDCDGVSGTAILVEALQSTGIEVTYSIPHRADDGHGIGKEAVEKAFKAGVQLGLSVDTGTTCLDACSAASQLGFDLIITDHHLPDEQLPNAFALLNPARQDCGFADGVLCGTGVAFFLLMATWKKLADMGKRPAYDLRQLLDRVAMATVADVMRLQGVNRVLVAHGLQQLADSPSIGMIALLRNAKVNRQRITVETIGFYLAPRINAAGRMRHGEEAMKLLCCRDAQEAEALATVLDTCNQERRKIEADTFKQATQKLEGSTLLAVYDSAWHAGVVGLVAGRLARQYGQPAAVGFVDHNNNIRVSLRGVQGFHIGQLLQSCAQYLMGFGGHAGAGGGTVKAEHWQAFVSSFEQAVLQQKNHGVMQKQSLVDGVLALSALHVGLASRLKRFEPTGQGNPVCVWLLSDIMIADNKKLKGGVLRLQLTDGQHFIPAVVFKAGALAERLQQGACVSLLGQLKQDEYRGGDAVQFIIEDVVE